MNPEQCHKCGENLASLQSNAHICKSSQNIVLAKWKLIGDSNRLQLDLITWSWRIREKKVKKSMLLLA
jgi:hypothetical protein